jgi:hypothetical protein
MDELDLVSLAARLYERRSEAVSIKRVRIDGGDWQPEPNQCHKNVILWCSRHPNQRAVRGWLVADYLDIYPGYYKFFAHSVVETETGVLIDLTPNVAPWEYPFLIHNPADGDFAEIVEGRGIINLTHRLPGRTDALSGVASENGTTGDDAKPAISVEEMHRRRAHVDDK